MGIEQLRSIETIGSIAHAIVAVTLLFAAAWGMGRILRRALCRGDQPTTSHEIAWLVAGMNLLGLIGLCLGCLGLLAERNSLVLLFGLSFAGLIEAWRSRMDKQLVICMKRWIAAKPSWDWIVIVAFVLLTLGPALNYPTGWDEMVYHSVLPRRWMNDGWPKFYIDLPYSGFPSLVEILCWMVAPVESIIAPRLFNWFCWLLALHCTFAIFRRMSNSYIAKVLTFSLSVSPICLMISENCYVEAVQLLELLAILSLLTDTSSVKNKQPHAITILIGILCGGCAAIKLTGVVSLAVPVAHMLQTAWSSTSTASRTGVRLAMLLMTTFLVASPFYVRPWVLSGNPFFPFFGDWFSQDANTIATSLFHHAIGADAFGMRGFVAYLTTPIFIAYDQSLFDGKFGFQWIVLLGICLLSMRHQITNKVCPPYLWLYLVNGLVYSFWFMTSQQARFAVGLIVFMSMVSGDYLRTVNMGLRHVTGVLLIGTSLLSLPWSHTGYYFASWECIFGIWSNTQYVDDSLEEEYVPLVKEVEQATDDNSKLLLVFENRSLYMPCPCIIGTPYFQSAGLTPPDQFSNAESLVDFCIQRNVTHIVFATRPIGPDRASEWWNRGEGLFQGVKEAIEREFVRVVWTSERYMLLEINGEKDQQKSAIPATNR